MMKDLLRDAQIIESWRKNAVPWTTAVREQQIASRKLITDRAIAEAIISRSPGSVLDLGCGEGWLVSYLTQHRVKAIGVDAVPELVAKAKQSSSAEFHVASYEEIIQGKLSLAVDLVVCNFSLFGREIVTKLFKTIPSLLNPGGLFIVQTLHPLMSCGNLPYQDGWREGSWIGFSDEFTAPPPWYFRTIASWIKLITDSGFKLEELREPIHPLSQKPASIVFIFSRTYALTEIESYEVNEQRIEEDFQ